MEAMRPQRHAEKTAMRWKVEGLPAMMANASGQSTNAMGYRSVMMAEICGPNCEKVGYSGGFACQSGQCISTDNKCDGNYYGNYAYNVKDETFQRNCADGSYETTDLCGANCEKVDMDMRGNRFACSNGQCMWKMWKCDGKRHCDDGSDETAEVCGDNCEKEERRWRCSNGQCIPASRKCNGCQDCDDGSDEVPDLCTDGYAEFCDCG